MLAATVLLVAAAPALAALSIVRPAESSWWIAGEDNTLQWTGTSPGTFQGIIYNDNSTLLTTGSSIFQTQEDSTRLSLTVKPNYIAGTGYYVQMVDPLNITNVYAKSEVFEIKKAGSAYPTTTPSVSSIAAAASAGTSSASAGASSAAASASTTPASGAAATVKAGGLAAVAVAAAAAIAAAL